MSSDFQQFLKSQGIIHQTTCPHTPQQNGVAEQKDRQLLEVVRASLIEAHMPLSYSGEALISAAYLINRVPSVPLTFAHHHRHFLKLLLLHLSQTYLPMYSDVLLLSISTHINTPSCNLEHYDVCSWDMLYIKRAIAGIILLHAACLLPWMWCSMKHPCIFPLSLIFRGSTRRKFRRSGSRL